MLHSPYRNFKQIISGEPSQDVAEYIKKTYPEWSYMPEWKIGVHSHNFNEVINLLNKLDIKQVNENSLLFNESIRITIKNNDNGISTTKLLAPTHGTFFIIKPFYSVSNSEFTGICDGSNLEVTIEYKGIKGYSINFLAK